MGCFVGVRSLPFSALHFLRLCSYVLLTSRHDFLPSFNMVAYSGTARRWKESIAPCTDENVATAIQWIAQLRPGGCSCLLHALKVV